MHLKFHIVFIRPRLQSPNQTSQMYLTSKFNLAGLSSGPVIAEALYPIEQLTLRHMRVTIPVHTKSYKNTVYR